MGRPKGSTNDRLWRDAIRKAALERLKGKSKPQQIERAARALVAAAADGDIHAAREMGDRLDGKPRQTITGDDGGPLVVQVVRFADDPG